MRGSSSLLWLVLVLACNAPVGSARGTVLVGDEGEAGAQVTLWGPSTVTTTTDATGVWKATLAPGAWALTVTAPDTARAQVVTFTVRAGHLTELEAVSLTALGRVVGHVTAGAAPASVALVGGGGVVTDETHGFSLSGVAGQRDLVVSADGFVPQRFTLDVRRGAATRLDVTLEPVDVTLATTGSLEGHAWLPGATDHSGITVEVEGTSLTTTTAADGAFHFTQVPGGVVALAFHAGEAWARLGKVLVMPGGKGFIIDGGLYALSAQPIVLRKERLLRTNPVDVVGFSAPWVVMTSNTSTWLVSTHGLIIDVAPRRFSPWSWTSALGVRGTGFDVLTTSERAELSLTHTDLITGVTTVTHTFPSNNSLGHLVIAGSGVAWQDNQHLWLKASPGAIPVSTPCDWRSGLVSLSDGTVLALFQSTLVNWRLDGTEVGRVVVPQNLGADLRLSADERFVVIGTGYDYGAIPGAVLDRLTGALRNLPPCTSVTLSPDSTSLICASPEPTLVDLQTGATEQLLASTQWWKTVWLPDGMVAVLATGPTSQPIMHLWRGSRPAIDLDGLSWNSNDLRVASSGHLQLYAHEDLSTGLGQALDVSLGDGAMVVVADGVRPTPFLATDRGFVVGRPRSIGLDVDLVFAPYAGEEVPIGRWTSASQYDTNLTSSGQAIAGMRFNPDCGVETWLLDTTPGATSITTINACSSNGLWWAGERSLVETVRAGAPFSDTSGVYSLELP